MNEYAGRVPPAAAPVTISTAQRGTGETLARRGHGGDTEENGTARRDGGRPGQEDAVTLDSGIDDLQEILAKLARIPLAATMLRGLTQPHQAREMLWLVQLARDNAAVTAGLKPPVLFPVFLSPPPELDGTLPVSEHVFQRLVGLLQSLREVTGLPPPESGTRGNILLALAGWANPQAALTTGSLADGSPPPLREEAGEVLRLMHEEITAWTARNGGESHLLPFCLRGNIQIAFLHLRRRSRQKDTEQDADVGTDGTDGLHFSLALFLERLGLAQIDGLFHDRFLGLHLILGEPPDGATGRLIRERVENAATASGLTCCFRLGKPGTRPAAVGGELLA